MSLRHTLWLSIAIILALVMVACGAKPNAGDAGAGAVAPTAQPAVPSNPTSVPTEPPQQATQPATTGPGATATTPGSADADPEPNTMAQARAIQSGKTTASLIEDDEDWFMIGVPASGIVTIAFTPEAGAQPMEVALSEVSGGEIWREYDVQAATTKTVNRVLSSAKAIDYAVMVAGGPGQYTLDVTISSQDDGGSGADAGDAPASALPLAPGKAYAGMIGDDDLEDFYKLDLKAGAVATVAFTPLDGTGGMDVAFLTADMNEAWRDYAVAKGVTKSYTAILSHADAGSFYVRVSGTKGEYQLEIAAETQDDVGSGKDAGDKPATAVPVDLGKSYTGLIGDMDWEDLYRFEAKGGDIISVAFTPGSDTEPMDVAVLDRDQNEMWREWGVPSGSSKAFSHILDANAGGTYYVAVIGGRGTYALDLSASEQNDAGSGRDAGATPADVVEVQPNATYSGQIGGSDSEDLYTFDVPGGSVITVSFTPARDAGRLGVALLDPDLNELWREWGVGPGVTKSATYVVGVDGGGPYYVWAGEPSSQDSYTFEITVASQMDGGWDGDAGDAPEDAVPVEADTDVTGIVGDGDRQDYYQFEPEEGQVITFTPARGAEPMDVFVLDADENSIWEEYSVRAGRVVTYSIDAVEGETPYYILVVGGKGSYTIRID